MLVDLARCMRTSSVSGTTAWLEGQAGRRGHLMERGLRHHFTDADLVALAVQSSLHGGCVHLLLRLGAGHAARGF